MSPVAVAFRPSPDGSSGTTLLTVLALQLPLVLAHLFTQFFDLSGDSMNYLSINSFSE